MYRITLGLYLYLAVFADAVYRNCDSQIESYNNVTVSNCNPIASKCILPRGKNTTIEINFNLDKDIKRVSTVVRGVIVNFPLPYPLTVTDACEASGLKCPLTKDDGPYSYKLDLPVKKDFPRVLI
ncbi:hypothetical protein G9C98_005069 [Cotesia typhae]|uniref:MD-2-related lipid-recognition domain-containing protein n=1 Tax=Cotesia typhae TaxID=2053667 RepID=A0A8J5UYV7_9HYME|nr:hypothetical protein G9C98_005069 [Cotesia typhae]